jgi:hypothetical protein
MQITKKQLKEIISEEVEKISEEQEKIETLLENYAIDYGGNDESVPKEALIDFLQIMDENAIPKHAFESFMQSLPESTVTNILSEVVEEK